MTLNAVPFGTVLTETPREPEWLLRGLIVGGALTLISGLPKSGKSTVMLGMLAAISRGTDFAGLSTRPAKAVVLTEEPRSAFREKLERFDLDDEAGVAVFWTDEHATPWPTLVNEAAKHASEIGAQLLVVDTWARFAGLSGEQENLAGAVLACLAPLNIAAAENGLAVVLLAHRRKTPGEFGSAVRGSNALVGSVDIVAEYEPPPPGMRASGNARLLRALSRYGATPEELLLELDGGYFSTHEIEGRTEHDRVLILETLAGADTALTVDELERRTTLNAKTIRRRLDELEDQVVTTGSGVRGDPVRYALVQSSLLKKAA